MLFGVGINDFENVHGFKPSSRKDGGYRDKRYTMWQAMLARCYSKYTKSVRPTYIDVKCDPNWTRYSKFHEDLKSMVGFENAVNGDWVLDKDILVKGNKIYSSETCCFVPPEINGCFTLRTLNRGELPIGVSKNRYGLPYKARCGHNGERVLIGNYKTPEEAFQAYKSVKMKEILRLAEKWEGKIDDKVYQALLQWKIEITD